MLSVTTSIRNGKFTKQSQELIRDYISSHEGRNVTFEIKLVGKITYAQYRYLYGVVYPILKKGFEDVTGEKFSIEDIDTMCKMKFHFTEKIDFETGEVCKIIEKKREMNKTELAIYIEKCVQYGIVTFGLSFERENADEVTIIHNV